MNISSGVGLRVVASAWLMLTPLVGSLGGDEAGAGETPNATAEPASAGSGAAPAPVPEAPRALSNNRLRGPPSWS